MKERPILFQGAMVRAILDGSKTQTRRAVKPQPSGIVGGPGITMPDGSEAPFTPIDESVKPYGREIHCPYGVAGDRLWVRENFQPLLDSVVDRRGANWKTGAGYAVGYVATDGVRSYLDVDNNIRHGCKPSIHMPRWASRISLEITNIGIERLNDCRDEDALAEGITGPHGVGYQAYRMPDDSKPRYSSATAAFEALWDQVNGPGSWAANPWVWVISFRRLDQ